MRLGTCQPAPPWSPPPVSRQTSDQLSHSACHSASMAWLLGNATTPATLGRHGCVCPGGCQGWHVPSLNIYIYILFDQIFSYFLWKYCWIMILSHFRWLFFLAFSWYASNISFHFKIKNIFQYLFKVRV